MKKDKYQKKVSIIMATYNTDEEQLKLSINSILKQTYKNIELIIICDGNKEEYEKIINTYKDNRIKCILNEKNIGLAASLNKAIQNSTGEYIARMDSDDICLKDRIEKQVNFLSENQDIDLCGMYANSFGKKNNIMALHYYQKLDINIQLLYECCLIHPTVMFKKDFIKNNNIKYNEEFKCTQDYELWSRIVNNNAYVIPKIGIYYRLHNKQITSQKRNDQEKMTKIIIERNIKNIKDKYNYDASYILYKLSALNKISLDEVEKLSNELDQFIEIISTNSNKKQITKILNNKFFKRVINDNLLQKNILYFINKKELRKKCFTGYNIYFLIKKTYYHIKNIINIKFRLRKWQNELIKN